MRAVKLVGGGRVLAHAGGNTWMVRGGLPGELIRARPSRRRAGIVEAETLGIVDDPHPARLDEPCPHASGCGGCDWPHVDPEAGAALKAMVAAEAAARFPTIADRLAVAPVQNSPAAYRLRNRLHWDPRNLVLGFYAPRSRRVSEIRHCRIISPALSDRLSVLARALDGRCPRPVDLEILESAGTIIAALRPARGGPTSLDPGWLPPPDICPGIGGFHRLTRGDALVPGWGRHHVRMDLPVPLAVPLGSFFQGNRHLIHWLFQRAAALIGPGTEPVIDLHGGVGYLAAAARWAGRTDLTVVEPHSGSADAARRNLPDARVEPTNAESFLADNPALSRRSVVVTDPPRSGMTAELRGRLARWRPDRIVMMGCDPATWSRDTAELMAVGYSLTHLELADLFPFTHHVEVVAVLEPK
jgi:23S rRNA (uracil1939-C5)-methyltransferase